jgi:ribose 5-phosphate isomerase B
VKIAIGADHGGYKLKASLITYLKKAKYSVFDAGAFNEESCDYPDFADKVTRLILQRKAKFGILICKSGLGMSMSANRKQGIRAALCQNIKMVKSSREHNNANILVLGATYTGADLAKRMCSAFLNTKFLGGRHARRVKKMEKEF